MYLISYDIGKDSLRKRISDKLIEFGLYRMQYSVFLGAVKKVDYDELLKWLQDIIQKADKTKDSIIIIHLEKPQVKNMLTLGVQKLNISEIIGEKDTLVFQI